MSTGNKRLPSYFLRRLGSFLNISRSFETLWETLRNGAVKSGAGDEYIITDGTDDYVVGVMDSYVHIKEDCNVLLPESKDRQLLTIFGSSSGEFTANVSPTGVGVTLAGKTLGTTVEKGDSLTLRYVSEDKDWVIISFYS